MTLPVAIAILGAAGPSVVAEVATSNSLADSRGAVGSVAKGTFTSNRTFAQVFATGTGLKIAESDAPVGDPAHGACADVDVNPDSLVATVPTSTSCEDPATYGAADIPYSTGWGTGYTAGHVAYFGPDDKVQLGPALFNVQDTSGSRPVWAYGAGYLWVYELAPPRGPTVYQLSEATGQIIRAVTVPPFVRAIAAANKNGFYLAGAGSFGASASAEIVRVAPNAPRAQVVVSGVGDYAAWVIADGDELWTDMCHRPASHCEITRYRGPQLEKMLSVSDDGGTGDWAVGNAATGIFTTVPTGTKLAPAGTNVPFDLLRIDPITGVTRKLAVLELPQFGQDQGVIAFGHLYLLATEQPAQSRWSIYRVNL